jgi:hypothetical protein
VRRVGSPEFEAEPGSIEIRLQVAALGLDGASKSSLSMRTWSWNRSRWRTFCTEQPGCTCTAGAVCVDSGKEKASANALAARKPLMPRHRVASACRTSNAPAASRRQT